MSTAKKAAIAIIGDLSDRSGLGNAWEQADDGIQAEILQQWEELIAKHFPEARSVGPLGSEGQLVLEHVNMDTVVNFDESFGTHNKRSLNLVQWLVVEQAKQEIQEAIERMLYLIGY